MPGAWAAGRDLVHYHRGEDGVERAQDPAGYPVLITTTQIYTHVAQARKAEAIETFDAYRSLSVGEKRNKINAPH